MKDVEKYLEVQWPNESKSPNMVSQTPARPKQNEDDDDVNVSVYSCSKSNAPRPKPHIVR